MKEIIIDGQIYVPKSESVVSCDGLKYVLIRSYAAGVHIGYLLKENFTTSGKVVTLFKTRRIWYWAGAASISQLASTGSQKPDECKFSVELEENEIVNVIETIPVTSEAFNNFKKIKEWKV